MNCYEWFDDSIIYFVGTVDWNTVESSPTYFGVEDVELKELADALKILHVYCDTKDWNEDDFISVFEELTGAYYTIFSRHLTHWLLELFAKSAFFGHFGDF